MVFCAPVMIYSGFGLVEIFVVDGFANGMEPKVLTDLDSSFVVDELFQ